jgi:hypothetical protein
VPVTVNDARGTGVGWNATVASTLFTNLGGKTLPATASRITGVTSLAAEGTTATNPTNAVSYTGGVEVPAAAVAAATGVKFFNAALDTGMGEFTVTPTVEVSIPANSYSGAYTSTLTLSSVTGP